MLDTHLLAWLAGNGSRLRPAERDAVEQHADQLLVSAVSIWDLRLRWRSNPRRAAEDKLLEPIAVIRFCTERAITVLPLSGDVAPAVLSPPIDHTDPFDEMLLTHAGLAEAKLLTRDGRLRDHPLAYQP